MQNPYPFNSSPALGRLLAAMISTDPNDRDKPTLVKDLIEPLGKTQNTISEQLNALKKDGLAKQKKTGKNEDQRLKYYYIDYDALSKLIAKTLFLAIKSNAMFVLNKNRKLFEGGRDEKELPFLRKFDHVDHEKLTKLIRESFDFFFFRASLKRVLELKSIQQLPPKQTLVEYYISLFSVHDLMSSIRKSDRAFRDWGRSEEWYAEFSNYIDALSSVNPTTLSLIEDYLAYSLT